ncbi:MAG: molybdopterin-dependent oxidoreductase [Anaerolineae bacterium]
MDTVKKTPGIITGALVGLLLTAPLIALFYLGDQLAGLPFLPFDFFDWFGRQLPGGLITAVIDFMVDAIIALNLGETSSTAKTVEQVLGLSTLLGVGIAAGVLLFLLFARFKNEMLLGLGFGLVVGIIMALISAEVNLTASTSAAVSFVWVVAVFTAWGAAFSWIYTDLVKLPISKAAAESAVNPAASATTPQAAPNVQQLNRREFLVRVGGATATLTVLGTGLSLLLDGDPEPTTTDIPTAAGDSFSPTGELPNADAVVQPVPGTRPEYTPVEDHYRIDISSRPPVIEETEWTLNVEGLVAAPIALTLADLRDNYEPVDRFVTLSCISNRIAGDLISTTRWTGVPLVRLVEDWNLDPAATHLKITGADNFDEFVSLDLIREDERVMLTYAWDGRPLPRANGFPLRIYIPDRYGMKQPKWITTIEAVEEWGQGYWVRRGWSRDAMVRTTSVIDTVAVDHAIERDGQTFIPIGGIAYSGAKGISKVEVRVDEGEWQEAQLRDPLSPTTWVLWRYEWPFEAGVHSFFVRTYDAAGELQIAEENPVRPDGATGIHDVRQNIRDLA